MASESDTGPRELAATGHTAGAAGRCVEWVLSAACLVPLLFLPLARDQGIFAYAGQVIRDGGFPYRDVFEQKGPAVHYTYALALTVFGETEAGVRTLFFLVALLGAQLAAAMGGRLWGRSARLPCALCYALAAVQADGWAAWHTAQAEDIMLPLTLGAILLVSRPGELARGPRLALAGALLGIACLYKPTAAAPAAAIGVVALWWCVRAARVSGVELTRRLSWAAGGFLAPAAAFGLFFAVFGVLDDFWLCVVAYNVRAYAQASEWLTLDAVGFLDSRWRVLVLLALWGALWRRREEPLAWRLVCAALVGGWLAVWWQGKYFRYQWTPVVGLLAILAGGGVARLAAALGAAWRRRVVRRLAAAAAVLFVPWVAAPDGVFELVRVWRELAGAARGTGSLDEFQDQFMTGSRRAKVTRTVARYVASRTGAHETALVWGHETLVNFLSRRRSPSRVTIDAYLALDGPPQRAAWRGEFLAALAAAPPSCVIVVDDDPTPLERDDSMTQLRRFPELSAILDTQYEEDYELDHFHVYRRRTDAARGSQ